MKIVKYIFLLLFLFGIAITVFVATQPSDFIVQKEKTVAISKKNIFNYIANLENWKEWYPDLTNDSIEVKTNKAKTTLIWEQLFDETTIETAAVFLTDSLYLTKTIDGNTNTYFWKFSPKKDSTTVIWGIKGNLTLREKFASVFQGGAESIFANHLNEGLTNIANIISNDFSKHEIIVNGFTIKPQVNYIQIKDSCSITTFDKVRRKKLLALLKFAKENKIDVKGPSFTIFNDWDIKNNFTSFSICVPIDFEIVTTSNPAIQGGYLEAFLALKTTLKGSLDFRKNTWDKGFDYVLKNKHTQNESGSYIEVYKVADANRPSDLKTEFFIPVRKLIEEKSIGHTTTVKDTLAISPITSTDTIK